MDYPFGFLRHCWIEPHIYLSVGLLLASQSTPDSDCRRKYDVRGINQILMKYVKRFKIASREVGTIILNRVYSQSFIVSLSMGWYVSEAKQILFLGFIIFTFYDLKTY